MLTLLLTDILINNNKRLYINKLVNVLVSYSLTYSILYSIYYYILPFALLRASIAQDSLAVKGNRKYIYHRSYSYV